MNSKNLSTIKRLFKEYTIKHINKIFVAIFFSILVAGSTSAIAYLLDPAIEKIFINQDQTLMYLIPIAIIIVFLNASIGSSNFSIFLNPNLLNLSEISVDLTA